MLEWALEALSGDAALEELSEGSAGVLSAVAQRHDHRLVSAGLQPDPTPADIRAVLGRWQAALDEPALARKGITTDGAALAPEPSRDVCGAVPHHLCPFHVIQEGPQGVCKAVATERERVAQSKPKVPRGRPSSKAQEARRVARKSTARQQNIRDVVQDRLVCVTHRLKPSERQRLLHLTRGLPPLRTLREIMDHRYAVCDRRCRTPTALHKLKQLRQWGSRCPCLGETFKKVCSPHREHALTCLDDKVLPATSKALERGNRRHRQRQKSVSRVRSKVC